MHPVLGKTYRLDIDNVAWTKVRETCRRQVLEMIVRKSKPTPAALEVKAEKIQDNGDTSDSSDDGKKHFKHDKKHGKKQKNGKNKKHGKKQKKAKNSKNSKKAKKGGSSKKRKSSSSASATSESSSSSDGNAKKRQKEAEKNEKALQKKVQSDATKVLAKVRPLINNMAELMRHEHVDEMPKTIVKQMQAELEVLNNFEKEAREKIGSTATSLTFSVDDVAKASKAICDSMSTVKNMMKQAAKLF